MLSKKSVLFLLLLLLVITILLVYFYWQNNKLQKQPGTKDTIARQVINYPGNPIKKSALEDQSGIVYELEGNLVGSLELRSDGALKGKYVIKNDPLKREIPLVLGLGSKQIVFGKYQGSFTGNSTWEIKEVKNVMEEIKPGEQLYLFVRLYYPENNDSTGYFTDAQYNMDELIAEFNRKYFTLSLPADFILVPGKAGIIR